MTLFPSRSDHSEDSGGHHDGGDHGDRGDGIGNDHSHDTHRDDGDDHDDDDGGDDPIRSAIHDGFEEDSIHRGYCHDPMTRKHHNMVWGTRCPNPMSYLSRIE